MKLLDYPDCARAYAACWSAPLVFVVGVSLAHGGTSGPPCDPPPSCATTACWVPCDSRGASELSVRKAVHAANNCANDPTYTTRNIYFAFTDTSTSCTLNLANTDASAQGYALCPAGSVPNDVYRRSICLTGHDIFVTGGNVVHLVYIGPQGNPPCAGACRETAGPPAFVLQGHHNSIFGLSTAFFEEGIRIDRGANQIIESVTSNFYCDEAVAIEPGPPSEPTVGAYVHLNNFRGYTVDSNNSNACTKTTGSCGVTGHTCGIDKAIQVNGGSSTIRQNTFANARVPIRVTGGSHSIENNTVTGMIPGSCTAQTRCKSDSWGGDYCLDCSDDNSNNPDNYCSGIEVGDDDGGASPGVVTATGNAMDFCKFGLRVEQGGSLVAASNTITNGYQSAINVVAPATLSGTGNLLKGSGWWDNGRCDRGALVVENNVGSAAVNVHLDGSNTFCQRDQCIRGARKPDVKNTGADCTGSGGCTCDTAHSAAHDVYAQTNCYEGTGGADEAGVKIHTSDTGGDGSCGCVCP